MNKVKVTTQFLTKEMLRYLWQTYAWVAGIVVLLPLFFSIFQGSLTWRSFANDIASMPISFVNFFLMFFVTALTYENFKTLIQNGISRHTYWRAKVNLILIMAVVFTVIDLLYTLIFRVSIGTFTWANSSWYMLAYGQAIKTYWLSFVMGIIFNLIATITWGFFAQAVGSIFSLIDKKLRRILYIVLPILAFFIIFFISGGLVYLRAFWVLKMLAVMLGGNPALDYFTPWVPLVEMLIFSAIMLWVSHHFNQKLILRRD